MVVSVIVPLRSLQFRLLWPECPGDGVVAVHLLPAEHPPPLRVAAPGLRAAAGEPFSVHLALDLIIEIMLGTGI